MKLPFIQSKNQTGAQGPGPDIRPYVAAIYRGNRLKFALLLGLYFVIILILLAQSWLLGELIEVITAPSRQRILRDVVIAAVLIVGLGLVQLAQAPLQSRFVHKGLAQYKETLFAALTRKNISAFTKENTARYLSGLTNDVNSIEENYIFGSIYIVFYLLLSAGALSVMLALCWQLALVGILLSVLPGVGSMLMGSEMTRREKAVSDENEHFVGQVKDFLGGFAVVKSFKAESQSRERFARQNRVLEAVKGRRRFWKVCVNSFANFSSSIFQIGVLLAGVWFALQGDLAVGAVLNITNLCNYISETLLQLPQLWSGYQASRGLIEKAAAVVEQNTAQGGTPLPPVLEDAVTLDHVSYTYGGDTPALQDVTLRFEAGKSYAVVGGSGSGKSTLLNLLMGAFRDYEGSVQIDGRELRDADPDSLYDLFSLIGQNVFLFDDTLRSNVTMFAPCDEDDLLRAVERSGLGELVQERGLDMPCGENGSNLSGGEKQRVSIARSLLRGTPVLLLDEATAALDNRTAFAVTKEILDLEGLTRVVVTHRLEKSLLTRYDEIIAMRDGKICERGTFEELMSRPGYFYSLYTVSGGA